MSITVYTLTSEPSGAIYHDLIAHGAQICARAQLVMRRTIGAAAEATSVLRELSEFLLEERAVSAWPGTRLLFSHTAQLFTYRLSSQCADILTSSVNALFEWVQPNRPEDLSLLFPDGTPWLTTIAHERDAYLSMTEEQAADFFRAYPRFLAIVTRSAS
jgi:hypothetical protein